jgi:hypothetical protein
MISSTLRFLTIFTPKTSIFPDKRIRGLAPPEGPISRMYGHIVTIHAKRRLNGGGWTPQKKCNGVRCAESLGNPAKWKCKENVRCVRCAESLGKSGRLVFFAMPFLFL